MSYCSFFTDDWHCDLDVEADVAGGYTCRVATDRVLGDVPSIHWPQANTQEEIDIAVASVNAQFKFLQEADHEDIDLPLAGATFLAETAEILYDLLVSLRSLGYNFPDEVLTQVQAEIEAENHAQHP